MSESGVCNIKPEFLIPEQVKEINFNHISEKDQQKLNGAKRTGEDEEEVPKKLSKFEKKKLRGQNKSRGPSFRVDKSQELCCSLILLEEGEEIPKCTSKNCIALHDIEKYLEIKPKDLGDVCYNFELTGKCTRGLNCRFGNAHIVNARNKVDKEKFLNYEKSGPYTKNYLKTELQIALRKHDYNFTLGEKLIKYNDKKFKDPEKTQGAVTDEDIIKLLPNEKKTINFKDKLVLSPLTTVGNLPFRRICKEFGADVTCGEMAMCSSLLQGHIQEWALLKRHKSEDIFGVQLCASNPHLLVKCGMLLEKEAEVDFVDLNLGCPIELVYSKGAGCGLLRRKNVLRSCVKSMSDILSVPLTVKTRTGIYQNQNIAHEMAPLFREWGASLLTIHGRSREQRYTKLADWDYIKKVTEAAAPMPVLGNGDILSYDDYKKATELIPDLTSVMIGRGALIKPWIFTEIKEQKLWDITSSERFDIIKKYVNYGLEHWGSDSKGVENTRRFLLEWLSFLYRYVPVGILERPPQKINERPPFYKGRDEMETLMASPAASDWIKISEMLLGPVPDGFKFLPKHKANCCG